jgi:RNA polymerase sigma-70 factor (ECF subfamily)
MNNIIVLTDQALHLLQKQIAVGDQRAFRQLFDFYAERLTRFAYSILKNKDAATEIVDEVFVKVWKNKESITEIEHLTTYLYTATKNASLNFLSRKANEQITDSFDFINIQLQDEDCPDQQMITSEIFKSIRAAVEDLPPRCKMIFKLVREDGLKYQEVADILHISVNTVDAQMVIAVKKISEKVKGHFDFLPRFVTKKS